MTAADQAGQRDTRFCGGKKRQGDGGPCQRPAGWGTSHVGTGACKLHGGATPNAGKAATVELARREVALWGGRRDVHPAQALLELVQWKAAEVEYWRARVSELDASDLTWGTTKSESGLDKGEPTDLRTQEAKPHVAHVMLRQAEQDLAAYAAASLKAGVDAALVRVAQSQADLLARVLHRLLADTRVTVVGEPSLIVMDALRALSGPEEPK